jgi:hypothetical protein
MSSRGLKKEGRDFLGQRWYNLMHAFGVLAVLGIAVAPSSVVPLKAEGPAQDQ